MAIESIAILFLMLVLLLLPLFWNKKSVEEVEFKPFKIRIKKLSEGALVLLILALFILSILARSLSLC